MAMEVQATKTPTTDNSQNIAISVSNVTVAYRSYEQRPTTIKDAILNFIKQGKIRYYDTFPALSNINFDVYKGEILGFIGSNGAGKSTLLNVLAGVLPPTGGHITSVGTIDSLRSLGAGFDSELNAIENIYLYGSLRGYSRARIKERVPIILNFAELEDFSLTPIKYYSSGMYARLGFACAIDTNPDILLVDEVLGVGDERFKEKCETVFKNFLKSGKTIVMVSHNMNTMERICSRIGLISKGTLAYLGEPAQAIKLYRDADYQTRLQKKAATGGSTTSATDSVIQNSTNQRAETTLVKEQGQPSE